MRQLVLATMLVEVEVVVSYTGVYASTACTGLREDVAHV
jgi:hypothetical protein